MTKDNIANEFNETFLELLKDIASMAPNTPVGKNIKDIESVFKKLDSKTKYKFIDNFILKVLKYQDQIESEDESFFFEELLKDEIKNDQSVVDSGINILELIPIWKKLKQNDRKSVFAYLRLLCDMCNDYLLL
ncbi:hypothetical protein Hokovirus_2_110 [Hokovirus HKV1]|mgnify:CR=1 FL=1|uniref:Uncharacterized protein n=1 Tax=Hokovirus HKV1 TaxID=1977638 RepID=A0A1V0SFU7_9VIRU|nr:hypothetical protein Hokovirus_2_110 [Hokovirus HKV1]